jgi:hypothetical protein
MIMKRYIDFILALIALIVSVTIAVIVVRVSVKRNGGSLFPVVEEVSKKKDAKQTSKTADGGNVVSYNSADEDVGTIFIGDSRFVGMDDAVDIASHDREFCVAKVGQGYNWLVDTGLDKIEAIRKKNTSLTKWRYVIDLGINDLPNIDKYIAEYKKISKADPTIQIILVSVNPVKNYKGRSNSDIEDFNDKLIDTGYDYIDTYTTLKNDGFTSTDGLHYDNETYEKIYDLIEKALKEL